MCTILGLGLNGSLCSVSTAGFGWLLGSAQAGGGLKRRTLPGARQSGARVIVVVFFGGGAGGWEDREKGG